MFPFILSLKKEVPSLAGDKRNRLVAFWTFLFSLLAHGFRWFNTSFNHDSLIVWQNDGGWQLYLGRYLVPFYLLVRGEIASPLLIAGFSVCFLIIALVLLVRILDIKRPLHIVLLCALLSTCPVFTLLYSTFISATDIHLLSILFSILSVWFLISFEKGWIPAAVSLALSMALYPSYAEVSIVLIMLLMIRDLTVNTESIVRPGMPGRIFGFLAISGILYYAVWLLAIQLKLGTGIEASPAADAYNSLNRLGDLRPSNLWGLLKGTYRDFWDYFFRPKTLHPFITGLLNIIIALGACSLVSVSARKKSKLIPCAILVLLLPLGADFVYILTNGMTHSLMVFSIVFLYSGVILCLGFDPPEDCTPKTRSAFRAVKAVITASLCFIVLFFTVTANQCHVKKNLEQQATLSVMTRVIDRMEGTEGYEAGKTFVVLVGDLNKSAAAQTRKGYSWRSFLPINGFSVSYFESYEHYFHDILGYPVNLGDRDTAKRFSEMDEVIAMPAFPSVGCTKMIDGVLVVKLSEDLSLQSSSVFNKELSDGY